MSALLAIAWFEFRTRVKRISTWVYFLVFFALAMLWTAAAGGAVPNAIVAFGSGKVWVNSPYAIAQTVAFLGMAALTIVAAVMLIRQRTTFSGLSQPLAASGFPLKPSFSSAAITSDIRFSARVS